MKNGQRCQKRGRRRTPWWEDMEQAERFGNLHLGTVVLGEIVQASARKAVETHGHARGCVCHLECKHPAGQACGDRDPRCLEGAK
jgi:hypothetical protein